MKITRHNYEEWFILYLDNELGSEDRREVELFVKENPDLQSELDILMQSQLTADPSVVFPGKQQLLKTEDAGLINKNNYEEWLVSYIDNELTAAGKLAVESLINAHPAFKQELELLQKTKLQPESIVFDNKASLYRSEEKVRVIAINWRRIAIAASLLLAVGTGALLLFKQDQKPAIVEQDQNKGAVPVQQKPNAVLAQRGETTREAATGSGETGKKIIEDKSQIAAVENKTKTTRPAIEKNTVKEVKQEEMAVNPKETKKSNELPAPTYNPNINKITPEDNPIAMNETREHDPLTISKETSPVTTVTPGASNALYTAKTSAETFEAVDANQPGKKNKLRGFFRKVTRTFEKNTNIKATDDEDRLLLGGLAIKL